MDYLTKAVSRNDLRRYSKILRRIFGVSLSGAFPVLDALERVPDIFPGSDVRIVEDDELPDNTMAQCYPNERGGMTVEVKDSVYQGAYSGNKGACRGFICHEICHLFLFAIGYTPIYGRSFEGGVTPAYRSVEWQAKALCGEVMIPYEESQGLEVLEITEKYGVSKAFAEFRRKQH